MLRGWMFVFTLSVACSWVSFALAAPHHDTARADEVERIKVLLKAGAEVNARDKRGGTTLHVAAGLAGDPAIVKALAAAGGDPNAGDRYGETPLHWAAAVSDTPAVIRVLVKAGARVDARTKHGRETPLH